MEEGTGQASPPVRLYQKSGFLLEMKFSIGTPTTKAVGYKLVTKYKPTALVVGGSIKIITLDF
jgi:hypothetical protein